MKIKNFEQNTLILENFEGPLAFLHYLVQKSELDISEIAMHEITDQYLKHLLSEASRDLTAGADFIDHTGALIWLKSKMLLPSSALDEEDDLEMHCPFDIIPQLIEYCRFKETARELSHREHGQDRHFPRGMTPDPEEFPQPLGIERIGIDELEALFVELLEKAKHHEKGVIHEEEWRVADKMAAIRETFKTKDRFHFSDMFSERPTKGEVVVTFLSLLELMKVGELAVVRETETGRILCLRCDDE